MSQRYRVAPEAFGVDDDDSTDSGVSIVSRYKLWLSDLRSRTIRLGNLLFHDSFLDDSVLAERISKTRLGLVNLFWIEKMIILIDYLQLYNIMWQCSQAYPWPTLWMQWTQWTAFANIDAFSMTGTGTTLGLEKHLGVPDYGKNDNYLYYAFSFSFVQFTFVLSFAYYKLAVCREYGNALVRFEGIVTRVVGSVLLLLYLPTALAVFRLYICEDGRLAADPSVTCLGSSHMAYAATCSLLLAPSFFFVPYSLYHYIQRSSCYKAKEDHEKRLQSLELRYIMGFDADWLDRQLWVCSSFNLQGMYFNFHILCLKMAYLALYIWGRGDKATQGILLWVATVVVYAHYCLHQPYRCGSSNKIMVVLLSALFVNSIFAMFNSCEVENSIFVESTESIVLLALNLAACFVLLVIAGVVFFYAAIKATESLQIFAELIDSISWAGSADYRRYRDTKQLDGWPVVRTLQRMCSDARTRNHLVDWVDAIAKGVERKVRFITTPNAITSITSLDTAIQSLRRRWVVAKAMGSLFEVVLTDLMETLIVLYSRRFTADVVRANENVVETDIDTLGDRYNRYINSGDKVLMTDLKRRLLFKLIVMGMFLSRTLCNRVNKVLEAVNKHYEFERAQLASLPVQEREWVAAKSYPSPLSIGGTGGPFMGASARGAALLGRKDAASADDDDDDEAPPLSAAERVGKAVSEDALCYSAAINDCLHSLDKNTEETINSFMRSTSAKEAADEVPMDLLSEMETMLLYWESLLTLHENSDLNFNEARFGPFKVPPEAWYTYRNSLRMYLSRVPEAGGGLGGDQPPLQRLEERREEDEDEESDGDDDGYEGVAVDLFAVEEGEGKGDEEEAVLVAEQLDPAPQLFRRNSSLVMSRGVFLAAAGMSRQASLARLEAGSSEV